MMPVRNLKLNLLLTFATAIALFALTSCARELPTAMKSGAQTTDRAGGGGGDDAGDATTHVTVTLAEGVSPQVIAADYSCTIVDYEPEELLLTLRPAAGVLPADVAAQMALDPRVQTAEQDGYLQTAEARQQSFAFDDGLGDGSAVAEQPAAQALHLDEAHDISQGAGIRVAILDTGVDPNHLMLRHRILAAWNFTNNTGNVTDVKTGVDANQNGFVDEAWGHGTHVAGIVAMTAPQADLLIGRVLDSEGRGDVSNVAAGIRWAVARGARVINLSLGTLNRSAAIQSALDVAEAHGVLVVASAGNWGADHPQEYPASANEATAIAATDVDATPTSWTSYASFVALTAPGVAIRSAYPGGGYRLWSGTSMSTPFVSGTAALLYALHPQWTPSRVLDRMNSTSQHLHAVPATMVGKLGEGMLDTGAALRPDRQLPIGDPTALPDGTPLSKQGLH
jgi:subtilisin family serine protease